MSEWWTNPRRLTSTYGVTDDDGSGSAARALVATYGFDHGAPEGLADYR
jgi:hypothetical protein